MPNDNTPSRKVTAAGLGGAVTIVVVWALTTWTGVDVPAFVASAFTTIATFGTGYIVKDSA